MKIKRKVTNPPILSKSYLKTIMNIEKEYSRKCSLTFIRLGQKCESPVFQYSPPIALPLMYFLSMSCYTPSNMLISNTITLLDTHTLNNHLINTYQNYTLSVSEEQYIVCCCQDMLKNPKTNSRPMTEGSPLLEPHVGMSTCTW